PKSGYMRAKVAQEKIIEDGNIPYSILHSTQFFEFAGSIVSGATEGETVRLSSSVFQPICSDEVVDALVDVILSDPINGTVEVADPEKMGMNEFAEIYMDQKNDQRLIISDAHALYFGTEIDDKSLTPGPNARLGATCYSDWIRLPGNLR